MRLLQLATGPGRFLDLHPNVTVVTGLDDTDRSVLASAVTGLARGEAPPGGGLLEAHGVLFDLRPDLLALLDVRADGIDPVVRPADLPSGPVSVDEQELRAREQAFAELLERVAAAVEEQAQARDAAQAAADALERARQARAEAEAGGTARRAELDRLTERAAQLRAEVETRTGALGAARAELDAAAGAATVAADHAPGTDTGRDGDDGAAVVPLVRERDEIQARIAQLERLLAVVHPVEWDAVAEALALLDAGGGGALVPSPEALELAATLDRIDARLARTPDLGEPDAAHREAARARLEEARAALAAAEAAARDPRADREAIERLEAAHDAVFDALDRADRRFAGPRARARVEALRAAEQEILDELGFASYADYVMGHSVRGRDPALDRAVADAREALDAAEHEWREIEAATEAALARAALLGERRSALARASDLLGGDPGPHPQDALRELRAPEVSVDAVAERLASALRSSGVDLGDEDLDLEELRLVGEAWLEEAQQVAERRRAALDELAQLRAEADRLAERTDDDPAAPDPSDTEALAPVLPLTTGEAVDEPASAAGDGEADERDRALAELEQALAAVTAELEEVEAARAALAAEPGTVDELDAEVERASAAHVAAIERLEAADRAVADLDADGQAAAAEIERLQEIVATQRTGEATPAEELEWYLLARAAAQRSTSIAGSLPLLLDDALRGLDPTGVDHVLGRLERMADAVQVVVVSDDPAVAEWAVQAGPTRAAVVQPTAAQGPD